ncbi:Alpha-1,2 mannosyltransferase [Podosphaera aphanis]|nr:Alpha-1,2 mannosyltransferase [Podosphaera aphanis]
MVSGTARYLRYILFSFFVLALFFFFSSSSNRLSTHILEKGKEWTGIPVKPSTPPIIIPPVEVPAIDFLPPTEVPPIATSTESVVASPAVPLESPATSVTAATSESSLLSAIKEQPRMNATFVTLARNSDVWEIARSIRQVEDRFNRKYHYDWVFLNDNPFDETFKKVTTSLISGKTYYGEIAKEHWSFPPHIDQEKARKVREDMAQRKIIYGDSISYRHMCRFESGFFFRQPLMNNYEWYWRVEPSIELYCDVDYDVFKYLADHKKKYGFVLSLYEYAETIPTLWESVKKFIKAHPEHIVKDNSMEFLSNDKGNSYNHCHMWSNFEIGNLDWFRSQAYIDYFESLDQDGGFFYERWGDAPVHSIAASLLLKKDEIHFFDDIAYYHVPFTHCPTSEKLRLDSKCHCNPNENFDWKAYSCTSRFFEINGLKKPEGYEKQQG